MQTDAENIKARRTRLVLAVILALGCVFNCWGIFSGFHYYPEVEASLRGSKDNRLKAVVHEIANGGRNVTGYVTVCSFLLGASAVVMYELLKRKPASNLQHEPASSDKVDHRTFFYCGLALALVTAIFGVLCCYVGYYTVNDVLDYRALDLGKLVLGYAAVHLGLWTWAIYHCKKQAAALN